MQSVRGVSKPVSFETDLLTDIKMGFAVESAPRKAILTAGPWPFRDGDRRAMIVVLFNRRLVVIEFDHAAVQAHPFSGCL